MVRAALSCLLLSLCPGISGLHAQSGAVSPIPSKTANSSRPSNREIWQQIHQRPTSRQRGAFAYPRVVADADPGASPNFAGFYTAPFISNVAPVSAGTDRIAFLTADVNHDGHPDLLSVDSSGGIAAAINDGTGHFGAPVITAPTLAAANTVDAAVSDVNGDGYPDVVVLTGGVLGGNGPGPQQFIVLVNQKDGTFKATATLDPANGPTSNSGYDPSYPSMAWTVGATSSTGLPCIVAEYLIQTPGSNAATFARTVFPNDGSGGFSNATQSTTTVPLSGGYSLFLTAPRLLLADVNQDGKPDLLTAYGLPLLGPFQVDIALGNGNGTFAAPLSNAAVSIPNNGSGLPNATGLAVANLSGNTSAAPDLLVSGENSVSLAAANGDGTFKAPVLIAEQGYPGVDIISGFRVTDVNGDGLPDLLVIGEGSLTMLPGKGTGSFDPAVGTVVTNTQESYDPGVAFADFDGDGKLDFIAASAGSADVVFGKGRGDGSFAATSFVDATTASVPSGAFGVLAALDLDGDGKTDLVGLNFNNGELFAAFAESGGSFTFKRTLSQISSGVFIQNYTADFNGDGKPDLIVEQVIDGSAPTYIPTEKVGVALSNGDGSFQDPVYASLPAAISADAPDGLRAGDLNGDGKLDLVLAYPSQGTDGQEAGGYCVLLGKGDGTFSAGTFIAFGATPTDVLLDHFHGSKAPLDLVIADTGEREFATPLVSILKGNGDGTFGAATTITSGQMSSGLLSADFNKDGNPDLIVPINFAYGPPPLYTRNFDQDGLALYMGHGDGSFSPATTLAPGSDPYYPLTADVNGDGNLDIVYDSSYLGPDDGLTVLLGHGDGTFAIALRYPMPAESNLAAGNFLGDNTESLIAAIPGAAAALVINQGGTVVTLASTPSTISAQVSPSLNGRPTPTGTGTFLDGTTVLGTGALANGAASADLSQLTVGTHVITFRYSGDANFQPNTASSTITVTTAPAPDFSINSSPDSLSVTPGQTVKTQLTITANAGLSGSVTFACSGLPAESNCSFAPASLTASPGQASTTTLSISTTAASSALRTLARVTRARTMTALAFLLIVPFFGGRRRFRLSLMIGVMILSTASLLGCGGSGSSSNGSTDTGSPAGSYTVTVTATSVAGGIPIMHTLPLTVVIQ
jgi:hypothetical protein